MHDIMCHYIIYRCAASDMLITMIFILNQHDQSYYDEHVKALDSDCSRHLINF